MFPDPSFADIVVWAEWVLVDDTPQRIYVDAWDGWYIDATEALTDAVPGIGREPTTIPSWRHIGWEDT